jgi:hypothetical protein
VTVGSLPTGLSLNNSNGDITGTPTATGPFSFTIQVTDDAGNTGTRAYSVSISAAAVIIVVNPATLPNGTDGVAYSQTVSAGGGTGPYTFAVTAGALPTGLSLDGNTGAITGTPTTPGSFPFTITATDSASATGTRDYTVDIAAAPALTLGPATLPDPANGTAYSQTLVASGGVGPYAFAVTAGALPPGLTLNPATGEISGTPTAAGPFSFTITVTDDNGSTASVAYTVTVQPGPTVVIDLPDLPDGQEGVPYTASLEVYGATGPYTYSVSVGALPPGLALDPSTGEVTGTPTLSGAFTFTLYVEDAFGNWGTRVFTMNVVARPDPSLDPEVSGIVGSHFDLAGRFAEGQLSTVSRHLEMVRGECGAAPAGEHSEDDEEDSGQGAASCDRAGLSFWGSVTAEEARDGRYDGGAVTGGVDWRFSRELVMGLAVGAGYGDDEVGSNGSGVDAIGESVTGYAMFNPFGGFYLEGTLGWATLDMNVDRYVTQDGSTASSDREAEVTFGSLGIDYELQLGAVRLSPYARYEFIEIELDIASERGTSPNNLTYLGSDRRMHSIVTGARVSMDFDMDWGLLAPYVRLEHRARTFGGYEQLLAYSDDLGTLYDLSEAGSSNSVWAIALGAHANLGVGQLGVELGSSGTDGGIFRDFVFRVEYRAVH